MALVTSIDYIYPPQMGDGDWSAHSGNKRVIVKLTGDYDSTTGETDAIKVDLSDLKTPAGNVPSKTAIEWIDYHLFGLTAILEWDRAPHKEICRINANGVEVSNKLDWSKYGGYVDPGGDDRTGDILLTTENCTDGDNYEITMCIRLKD